MLKIIEKTRIKMLVNLELLKNWTGYKNLYSIRKWLDENGINQKLKALKGGSPIII